LDVHVSSLRRKLGDADLVETVRGVGYRLVDEPGALA
jgi:DNA-binding response OmpR family regulator